MSYEFDTKQLADDYQAVEEYLDLQHLYYVLSTNDNNTSLLQYMSGVSFYRKHLFSTTGTTALESTAAQEGVISNLRDLLKLAKRMIAKTGLISANEAAALRKEAKSVDQEINRRTGKLLKEIQSAKLTSKPDHSTGPSHRHTYKTMIEVASLVVHLGNTINKAIRNSSADVSQTEFFEETKGVVDDLLDKYEVATHPNGSFSFSMAYITKREGGDESSEPWGEMNQVKLRDVLHKIAEMAHCDIVCYPIGEIIRHHEQPEDIDPIKKKYQLFCLNLMVSYVKTVKSISEAYLDDVRSLIVAYSRG